MDNIKKTFFKFKALDELKIQGQSIMLEEGTIDHTKLLLWPGNPRITHKAELHNEILEQDEIEDALNASGNIKDFKKKLRLISKSMSIFLLMKLLGRFLRVIVGSL